MALNTIDPAESKNRPAQVMQAAVKLSDRMGFETEFERATPQEGRAHWCALVDLLAAKEQELVSRSHDSTAAEAAA